MLNFDMSMGMLVFFALTGMMAWTMAVAAAVVQVLRMGFGIYDRHQYAKTIARMYRH